MNNIIDRTPPNQAAAFAAAGLKRLDYSVITVSGIELAEHIKKGQMQARRR